MRSGFGLGALCVMDYEPRRLTTEQREGMESLARLAVAMLEQRRVERRLRDSEERLRSVARATSEAERQRAARAASEVDRRFRATRTRGP